MVNSIDPDVITRSNNGGAMGAVKLTKIGNSQGFAIPKDLLEKSEFELGDTLEAYIYNGRLVVFKKPKHHSEMNFEGEQETEDLEWADSDLGEWETNK